MTHFASLGRKRSKKDRSRKEKGTSANLVKAFSLFLVLCTNMSFSSHSQLWTNQFRVKSKRKGRGKDVVMPGLASWVLTDLHDNIIPTHSSSSPTEVTQGNRVEAYNNQTFFFCLSQTNATKIVLPQYIKEKALGFVLFPFSFSFLFETTKTTNERTNDNGRP